MNRQPRALLSVLLIGSVLFIGWLYYRDTTPGPQPGDRTRTTEIKKPAPAAPPERGGVLTSSLRSEPRSFNRLGSTQASAGFVSELFSILTQAKLVRTNRVTQEVEPALAEKWTESADHKTFTLTLRDGLAWSDGVPFTSADVLFTIQAAYDPKSKSIIASSVMVNDQPLKVSAPDARTVVVTYPEVFGPGIRLLDNLTLMPKHKLEAALKAGRFGEAWNSSTPPSEMAGMGPFVLKSYEPGQRLVFDRNPHYWKKDDRGIQLPYLDQFILEIVADQNAELVRMQAGQIDMLQQGIRPEDIATLRPLVREGKVQILDLGVGADPDLFFFNLNKAYWAKDPRASWITRKEFRQAISHAVDREAFANSVFLGEGVPIWGPITPGNPKWFSPNVPRYAFSLQKAKDILASIGLVNRDQDEWLEDEKGNEARFTVITYPGNSSLERSAALLRDDLKAIGIAMDIAPIEQNTLIDRLDKNNFEAIYFYVTPTDLNPVMSPDLWMSNGSAHFWNMNQSGPSYDWEKQIDDLMRQITVSTDEAAAKKMFDQVQNIFAENLPVLYFVQPRLYMGLSNRVGPVTPSILRPQVMWNPEILSVKH